MSPVWNPSIQPRSQGLSSLTPGASEVPLHNLDGTVLFCVIWKATLTENWNSYLLSIYVIGNTPCGCWKRSTCPAFKAADVLNALESLLDRSFDWLDLIHGINLPQRLKRKVHSHWHLVVSAPFRLLKNKEEIARCQLNSKHGNFFAITIVLLKNSFRY